MAYLRPCHRGDLAAIVSISGDLIHVNDPGIVERTGSVREGCSNVVDGILVGPVACLLVDEEGVEEVLEERSVGVDSDGVEGEYHFCQSSQSTAASRGRW